MNWSLISTSIQRCLKNSCLWIEPTEPNRHASIQQKAGLVDEGKGQCHHSDCPFNAYFHHITILSHRGVFFFGKQAISHALFRFDSGEILILSLRNTCTSVWPLVWHNFEKHDCSTWKTIEGQKILQPRESSVPDKVCFPRESIDRVQDVTQAPAAS